MALLKLNNKFHDRDQLTAYVTEITPQIGPAVRSPFKGGLEEAKRLLDQIDPINYSKTRNYLDGKVTRLSPYIRHGILTLNQLRNKALNKCQEPVQIEKFIQELAWRDYWQRIYISHPEWIWKDVEPYKTGFTPDAYSDELPEDIDKARTNAACINQFIESLYKTGYLHNHARMYLAAYIVHWRRIKWQTGAKWMLHHLIDGDPASNNLSWQWIASTFSNKPYIFNLENVNKYSPETINTNPIENKPFDATYEELTHRLFPKIRSQS